jgi:RNA polymerase sigma-70 factor, ECF subfamily
MLPGSLKIPRSSILSLAMDERGRAIEQLYRERYVGFRNALATVTGSYETARDAVQEGFARALAGRARYRGDGPLGAWVWRIALRAALEQRGTPEVPLDQAVDPQLVEPERDTPLAQALATLSPRRRLIVFLHYYADLSYADIAAACDVSEGTVAATLAQAREALAATLDCEGVRP